LQKELGELKLKATGWNNMVEGQFENVKREKEELEEKLV